MHSHIFSLGVSLWVSECFYRKSLVYSSCFWVEGSRRRRWGGGGGLWSIGNAHREGDQIWALRLRLYSLVLQYTYHFFPCFLLSFISVEPWRRVRFWALSMFNQEIFSLRNVNQKLEYKTAFNLAKGAWVCCSAKMHGVLKLICPAPFSFLFVKCQTERLLLPVSCTSTPKIAYSYRQLCSLY